MKENLGRKKDWETSRNKHGCIATQNVETSQYFTMSAHKHITDDRLSSLFATDCQTSFWNNPALLPQEVFFNACAHKNWTKIRNSTWIFVHKLSIMIILSIFFKSQGITFKAELVEIWGRAQTNHYIMKGVTIKTNDNDILQARKNPCYVITEDLENINFAVRMHELLSDML